MCVPLRGQLLPLAAGSPSTALCEGEPPDPKHPGVERGALCGPVMVLGPAPACCPALCLRCTKAPQLAGGSWAWVLTQPWDPASSGSRPHSGPLCLPCSLGRRSRRSCRCPIASSAASLRCPVSSLPAHLNPRP